jgi:hypothetical protein
MLRTRSLRGSGMDCGRTGLQCNWGQTTRAVAVIIGCVNEHSSVPVQSAALRHPICSTYRSRPVQGAGITDRRPGALVDLPHDREDTRVLVQGMSPTPHVVQHLCGERASWMLRVTGPTRPDPTRPDPPWPWRTRPRRRGCSGRGQARDRGRARGACTCRSRPGHDGHRQVKSQAGRVL